MAAVETGAVLCQGLGGLPRSTSTTRRVYQGLGDPASHPPRPSNPAASLCVRQSRLSQLSGYLLPVLRAASCAPENSAR